MKKKNKKKENNIKMVNHDGEGREARGGLQQRGRAIQAGKREAADRKFHSGIKQMLALEMKGAGPQALDSLQRQRQAIVTELYAVGGDAVVQKLKAASQMEKEGLRQILPSYFSNLSSQ